MRFWHRFIAIITLLPLLVVVSTGILLQIKAWVPAIQPASQKSDRGAFRDNSEAIPYSAILEVAKADTQAAVTTWADIKVIDVRPQLGVARVRTTNHHELQIDLHTGKLLSSQRRYTSLLIELHEGAYFGALTRNAVFVPTAFGLLFLTLSGVLLLYRHYEYRLRKRLQ